MHIRLKAQSMKAKICYLFSTKISLKFKGGRKRKRELVLKQKQKSVRYDKIADIRTSYMCFNNAGTTDIPLLQKMRSLGASIGSSGRAEEEEGDDEASKLAIATYQTKEEEIERKKMEMRQKVESKLGRAEEEAKRLTQVWEELEVFIDPMRKEVTSVRKRLDVANRDIKSLGQICQKKEKEYREAMEAFQEKSKEKAQLSTALVELVNQSEEFRMNKLEELSNILNLNA